VDTVFENGKKIPGIMIRGEPERGPSNRAAKQLGKFS
jgi:hypothetical protein